MHRAEEIVNGHKSTRKACPLDRNTGALLNGSRAPAAANHHWRIAVTALAVRIIVCLVLRLPRSLPHAVRLGVVVNSRHHKLGREWLDVGERDGGYELFCIRGL